MTQGWGQLFMAQRGQFRMAFDNMTPYLIGDHRLPNGIPAAAGA
jgi:hypothetical protein